MRSGDLAGNLGQAFVSLVLPNEAVVGDGHLMGLPLPFPDQACAGFEGRCTRNPNIAPVVQCLAEIFQTFSQGTPISARVQFLGFVRNCPCQQITPDALRRR